ncbi:nuclear transport factor 2 family protein [Oceanobacillus polygoni]|uniref:Ketosteroid isomerase-like protein n=1 Tax=Oceanobacillus polygoni TaxID=1235259 RepID=A0A9X1CJZ3_9BACI|nr:nuclear transport factor 2 family protein [Oceanobacillus polygoni]MBP2079092.1 ketosteroid isomerase-like protein [Oceanobacillus polygoni]
MTKNQEFFQKINEAFATGDVDFILEHTAEDVVWNHVGQAVFEGKAAFAAEMEKMRGYTPQNYVTKQIITHGNSAVIEGSMTIPDEEGINKTYAFCDIYKLNKFKDGKIKELTAYLIEVNA